MDLDFPFPGPGWYDVRPACPRHPELGGIGPCRPVELSTAEEWNDLGMGAGESIDGKTWATTAIRHATREACIIAAAAEWPESDAQTHTVAEPGNLSRKES